MFLNKGDLVLHGLADIYDLFQWEGQGDTCLVWFPNANKNPILETDI